jgi:hypothetical protein
MPWRAGLALRRSRFRQTVRGDPSALQPQGDAFGVPQQGHVAEDADLLMGYREMGLARTVVTLLVALLASSEHLRGSGRDSAATFCPATDRKPDWRQCHDLDALSGTAGGPFRGRQQLLTLFEFGRPD